MVAETDEYGNWMRGYVYQGSGLLAVQQSGVYWVHEDPITKSKRVTDNLGNVVSAIELDPWGADTNRGWNTAFQPRKFTSYERDLNGSDDAMFRRYNRWHSLFDQPDPLDASYDISDPQSLNRYTYVQNDPVNLVDPTGLMCQVFSFEGTIQWVRDLGGWDPLLFNPFYGYNGTGRRGGGGPQDPRPAKTPTPPDPCVAAAFSAISPKARQTPTANKAISSLLSRASQAGFSAAQAAYLLATAEHESNLGNSMYEPKGFAAGMSYGVKWRGRGYIHLAGKTNYKKYGVADNPNSAAEPDKALDIAMAYMNPNALETYIPRNGEPDFVNARRLVNGTDRAKLVAGYADKYLDALKKCGYSAKGK